jgi:NAD(P)-dependent dehydrogenase (short-subunit alcohol dehydrogenase family)
MRARGGGSIINMGSTLPWSLGDNLFAYGCSKGAMYTMTRQLAGILRKDKIRANWVTIGWVLTEKEFEVQAGEGREDGWEVGQADQLPMGEFNTEADMAEACVYLASDAAARVTGTDLNVSAGLNIHI